LKDSADGEWNENISSSDASCASVKEGDRDRRSVDGETAVLNDREEVAREEADIEGARTESGGGDRARIEDIGLSAVGVGGWTCGDSRTSDGAGD